MPHVAHQFGRLLRVDDRPFDLGVTSRTGLSDPHRYQEAALVGHVVCGEHPQNLDGLFPRLGDAIRLPPQLVERFMDDISVFLDPQIQAKSSQPFSTDLSRERLSPTEKLSFRWSNIGERLTYHKDGTPLVQSQGSPALCVI